MFTAPRVSPFKFLLDRKHHALITAMARVNGDPKYKSYKEGYVLHKAVEEHLKVSGVDLFNGGGLKVLQLFQEYLSDYKIIVFEGLYPDRVMFSGNSPSAKKMYLLCDQDFRHYKVITKLKGAIAKNHL